MCTHVQYTLFEQSITVTIIDDDTCPFFEVSACFLFLCLFVYFFVPLLVLICC